MEVNTHDATLATMSARGWQFWIDRGGTFTDIVGRRPDGQLVCRKLLSENPQRYADAAVAGIGQILADSGGERRIEAIKMGTTVATNALLERRGEPTLLVITEGFGDALRIAYQNRPELFALDIRLPDLLYGAVVEAEERITADGEVLQALNPERLHDALKAHHERGYRAVAICFLHAYRHPDHERAAGAIARDIGFSQVSLSHQTSPLIKLVSRGDTTVADAYLSPVLRRYVDGLIAALADAGLHPERLQFMQSNGGLVDQRAFQGRDSVLSGPAGGVVGMVAACEGIGDEQLIGFDMGGTSTDVSLYARSFERVEETELAGIRLRAPMIRIHTIAAGGGSVLKFVGGRFQVGPESAGAQPGPLGYGADGPLTVTDANLMLGRLQPAHFPAVFGADGLQPLDHASVVAAFRKLADEVKGSSGSDWSAEAVAEGFVRVAVDNMANAIKTVSIQRGHDPAEFTLCCFGGAGGQHACQVADALGIRRVVLHPLASLLSAYGIGIAPLRVYRQASADMPLAQDQLPALMQLESELAAQCRMLLTEEGAAAGQISLETSLQVRIPGADSSIEIVWQGDLAAAIEAFRSAHAQRFGFRGETGDLQVDSLRVSGIGQVDDERILPDITAATPPEQTQVQLYCAGAWRPARLFRRSEACLEQTIAGPALVIDPDSTVVVEPGWRLHADPAGRLLLERVAQSTRAQTSTEADPVLLEVFNNHFVNIAEQMGAVLENTAHSVNIKERRDFSCALFDAEGRLIANAPHIPVHLGSMGDSVRAVLAQGRIRPGESWMLNDPYRGGTHLPDITVVTPVFDPRETRLQFVVACRAHHADVGGISPGSMPARSRHIDEEGLRCEPFALVRDGKLQLEQLRRRFTGGPYPARNPDQNLADLRAQLAANEKGLQQLRTMIEHFGLAAVQAYMVHIRRNAAGAVRSLLGHLQEGSGMAALDGGEQVTVAISIAPDRRSARIDFTGSSGQSAGNFNAPAGISRAAVLYCFRCLVQERIPLNDGCLEPLDIRIPEGSLLNPRWPAAVAAGNVETSQCIADALLAALNAQAGSQGSMNNLSFGNADHQYYETICGGSGAGPGFAGADAVHTHMTNSRITDAEVLESRFPVLLREFAIRADSGGAGRWPGGNGVVRAIEFRQAMTASILSNHRSRGAAGLAGGEAGKRGSNLLVHAHGAVETLPAVAEVELEPGDMLVIATPGGGGYGKSGSN